MTSVLYVLLSLCGAAIGGALGAVVGSALAMWCGAFVYWWQFVVALRESERPVSQVALTG
jgi:ABC-type nitrate/sulfonate/bicarbonate transport system permease component